MKLILITTAALFPVFSDGFMIGGHNNMGKSATLRTVEAQIGPLPSTNRRNFQRFARQTDDLDEAFKNLQRELRDDYLDGPGSTRNKADDDDIVTKSKKWVNRYYDLFSGLNQDGLLSDEDADRTDEVLRKQREWANKVIDFAAELGQDLSYLDLDGMSRRGGDPKRRADGPGPVRPAESPVYRILDNAKVFQVAIELPGVNLDQINIQLESDTNVLVVSGQRPSIENESPVNFTQRFELGTDVDTDKISAKLALGILTVSAPKVSKVTEDKNRRIPIT